MTRSHFHRWGGIAAALVLLFTSCETLKFSLLKDPELVQGGVDAWNADKQDTARAYWNAIKDPALKAEWTGKADQYDALEKTFDDAAALPASPEQPLLDAWDGALKALAAWPSDLKRPDTFLPRLVPVAKAIVRGRLDAEKFPAAEAFMKTATDALGNLVDWTDERQEIKDFQKTQETATAYRALDKSLDKSTAEVVASAKAVPDFDDRIAALEAAVPVITKAENTLTAQAKTNGYKEASALFQLTAKYKTRRADVRTEIERQVRDRATSFKERIGEEFARSPDAVGTSDPEGIVRFYEQTKTNIDAMEAELIAFSTKYPKSFDKDTLKDVADQKKALEDRIVVVTAEWRKAQHDAAVAAELKSRGNPVFPLLIGLFNPQPGTKGNDAKSRPAKFRGTLDGDAAYWWGTTEIAPGTLNDLVVTVSDGRPVRVFSDNTLSGKAVASKKLKDLVNKQYKVGNSWPVINAGDQLPSSRYFFEVGKGKEAKYSGDVVVYSSFIVRMR